MRKVLIFGCLTMAGIASALASEPSIAGEWRVERIDGVTSFVASKTGLDFAKDGHVSTTIGCNRLTGKPVVHGKELRFGPMAATRMACVPPLDEVEQKYTAALDAVRGFRIDGDKLTLSGEGGGGLVVLRRKR